MTAIRQERAQCGGGGGGGDSNTRVEQAFWACQAVLVFVFIQLFDGLLCLMLACRFPSSLVWRKERKGGISKRGKSSGKEKN